MVTGQDFSRGRSYTEVVSASIRGGAAVVQLREKLWPAAQLLKTGQELRRMTREAGVIFIVNDRVDLALALEADGVHVGQQDLPLETVRRIVGTGMIVGVSAGTPEEALLAEKNGASYIGVGPIFPTDTKKDALSPRGLSLLGEIRAATRLPIYGIGGIKVENAASVIRAGADGVAVVSSVVGADDIEAAARALVAEINKARN